MVVCARRSFIMDLESIPEIPAPIHQSFLDSLAHHKKSLKSKLADMATLEQLDPLYHFSTRFPDRVLTGLDIIMTTEKKQSLRNKRKNNPRYKTQPITFDEIKEVEEPAETPIEHKSFGSGSFLDNLSQKQDNRLTANSPSQVKVELKVYGTDGHLEPLYDTHYPEKFSFLDMPEHLSPNNRTNKSEKKNTVKGRRDRRRNNPRFKTQPITFDEIKEVEEPIDSPTQSCKGLLDKPQNSMDILFNQTKSTLAGQVCSEA